MQDEGFSDAALVLIGHGSTKNTESARPVRQHAESFRKKGIFAQVKECFWKQEPFVCDVLQDIAAPRVFVAPLFISEGYFTQEALPRELGLLTKEKLEFKPIQLRKGQTIHYCNPVGTHESMTDVLLRRARDIVFRHPFPNAPSPAETTLFIAGHGTGINEKSRLAIEHQANLIRQRNQYAAVHAVFMEEHPRVENSLTMTKTQSLVIVPFFISDGLHTNEDIPVRLGEPRARVQKRLAAGCPTWTNPTERMGKRIWYSNSIGSEPGIAEVILERVKEIAAKERQD